MKESSHFTKRKLPCKADTSWGQTLEQQAKEDVSGEGRWKKGSPSLAKSEEKYEWLQAVYILFF